MKVISHTKDGNIKLKALLNFQYQFKGDKVIKIFMNGYCFNNNKKVFIAKFITV